MLPAILLVDDEEELLDFLERNLQVSYTLFKARDAEAALEVLTAESIQLVISDVIMPGINGFQLCNLIKSNLELSHLPVVLLTANQAVGAKVRGLEIGADAYIEKPFSIRHLEAQVGSLLANRQRLKAHFSRSPLVHLKSMAYNRTEEAFLELLNETIVSNLENSALDIEMVSGILNMSRATLYRKIKMISGLAPAEFINVIRLKKAAALLAAGDRKIYEVAAITGFSSQSNFTRNFHRQFNKTPSEYLRDLQVGRRPE